MPFKLQILKYCSDFIVTSEYDGMSNYINLTVENKVSQMLLRLDVLHSRIEYLMNNEITNELLLEYIREVKPELFV